LISKPQRQNDWGAVFCGRVAPGPGMLPESGALYTWIQGECSTQIKHSIGAKVEISPKGFTLGVKDFKKSFQSAQSY